MHPSRRNRLTGLAATGFLLWASFGRAESTSSILRRISWMHRALSRNCKTHGSRG